MYKRTSSIVFLELCGFRIRLTISRVVLFPNAFNVPPHIRHAFFTIMDPYDDYHSYNLDTLCINAHEVLHF